MDFLSEISPVEYSNGIYLKRNDKLKIYGCNGGKSQGAYFFNTERKKQRKISEIRTKKKIIRCT